MERLYGRLIHMNPSPELQQLAREVERLRHLLEELHLRIEQVEGVLSEHEVTTSILHSLEQNPNVNQSQTYIPIGSGVSLAYTPPTGGRGTALIDLGSTIFGELPWDEARRLTEVRREDISGLRDDLEQQAQTIEQQLTTAATRFNALAQQSIPSTSETTSHEIVEEIEEDSHDSPPKKSPRKRVQFGQGLTLDD